MKNSISVKNLVFDFGGVIYQIDHEKQIREFLSLGIKNFEQYYSQAMQKPLFADFEMGHISENDFRKEVNRFLGLSLSDEQIDRTWNSILVDYLEESVSLLLNLKSRYQLFLLSNTNSIHYRLYINQFYEKYGYNFNSLFQKSYWSFQIGMRKPGSEVFGYVLKNSHINPEETLFIDDSVQNTIASADAGLPSLWLKPGKKLGDFFDDNLTLMYE